MEIALNQDLTTGELLQKFPKKKRRTVQRRIKYLKENNEILQVRIRGKKGVRKHNWGIAHAKRLNPSERVVLDNLFCITISI